MNRDQIGRIMSARVVIAATLLAIAGGGLGVVRADGEVEVREAERVLAKNPDDPQANLVRGRFLCLHENDWAAGLPLLAKGSDPQLQAAARKDLEEQASGKTPAAAGDAWWKLAEGQDEPTKHALWDRAAHWYRKALPEAGGLSKTRLNLRLAQIKGAARKPSAKDAAGEKPAAAVGPWVDLLPRVNIEKDALAGTWRMQNNALKATAEDASAKLLIPWLPKESYDLQLTFARNSGDGPLAVILPVGPRLCAAVFNLPGGKHGIDQIAGQRADRNPSTFAAAINTGRSYVLEIAVRVTGESATITANVDGRPWFFYRGPASALSLAEEWKTSNRPSMALATRCDATFSSLKLRKVSGEIVPAR